MPHWRPSAGGGWGWLSLEEGTSMTGQVCGILETGDIFYCGRCSCWPGDHQRMTIICSLLKQTTHGTDYTWLPPRSHSESMHTLTDDPDGQCGRAERMWTVKGVRPRLESRLCSFSISPSFLSTLPLLFAPSLSPPRLPPLIPSIHSPNTDWVVMLVCAKCWGYGGDQGRHAIPSLMGPAVERLLNSCYEGCECV